MKVTVSDNYEEKRKLKAFNKSSDLCLNTVKLNVEEKAEKELKKHDSSLNTSNSTLSLHITAFENSVKADASDTIKKWENEKQIFNASKFVIQNPFEFPRQENDKISEPEISQFQASQRLFNLNEASKNGQENVSVSQQKINANFVLQQEQQQNELTVNAVQISAEMDVRCEDCDQEVEGRALFVEDKVFHRNHFRCAECQLSIRHFYYLSADEKPLCYSCKSLQHPLCKRCNTFVGETFIRAENQCYHLDCFVCSGCNKPFPVHLIIIFLVIFVVGISVHELFEKPLRNASNYINIFVILIFYAFFIAFYLTQQITVIQATESKNMTLDEKIAYNIEMSQEAPDNFCIKDENIVTFYELKPSKSHDWRCSYTLVSNVTHRKEAVVLGNSFAAAQFSGISQALKILGFTKIYLIARSGCLPHGGKLNREYLQPEFECNTWFENAFENFLLAVQPEFIFISARLTMFTDLMTPLPPPAQLPNDFAVQQLQKGILQLSKFTKKLIIISPNPDVEFSNMKLDAAHLATLKTMINFTYNSASNIARNLQLGLPLNEFILPLKYAYEVTHPPEDRLITSMKNCSNCLFFNTTEIFCNKNGCPLYDEKTEFAILRDSSHLSVTAVEKLGNSLIKFLQ